MDLRPLLEIISDGTFHSGEKIGKSLIISRTAVWKQIDRLRSLGVDIHAVTGKGYRLPEPMTLLDRDVILQMLGNNADYWAPRLELTFSTGSTNRDVMLRAQQGANSCVHLAEHQSEGRGRRGREWKSPLGSNICMSMLVSFQSGVAALEGLSLAVAVMVVNALRDTGYSGFRLKWPNDILLEGKKLAGILLEMTGDVSGPCKVVVGIGINVNLPVAIKAAIDQPVINLAELFVAVPDRNKIVASLINSLSSGLAIFAKQGFVAFRDQWDLLDYYKGRVVRIGSSIETVEGRVKGVDQSGALLLETQDGIKVITGGELLPSLRPL